jgi:hypothetical protein
MKHLLLLAVSALILMSCQESLEERIARENKEFTQTKCPMPLNTESTMYLDSIVFDIPTLTQSQYFRINDFAIPTDQLRQALISELRQEPKYKAHREKGYSFHYIYRYLNNPDSVLFETTIVKEDYQ